MPAMGKGRMGGTDASSRLLVEAVDQHDSIYVCTSAASSYSHQCLNLSHGSHHALASAIPCVTITPQLANDPVV